LINPEALTAKLLREWLLQELPASIATVNATRAAVLRAPRPGPYIFPANAILKTSSSDKAGTTNSTALVSGTATAVAAQFDGLAITATVDADDHLLLTTVNGAPSFNATTGATTDSLVAVGPDATGANIGLGFDVSGEFVFRTALVPPGLAGVCDGLPLGMWFDPSQMGKGRVLVTIGERSGTPKNDNPRNFEWNVTLDVNIFRAEPQQVYDTREPIQAALQAVRAMFHTDQGMPLGPSGLRAGIGLGSIGATKIAGQPLTFMRTGSDGTKHPGPLFDAASFPFRCRVYQSS